MSKWNSSLCWETERPSGSLHPFEREPTEFTEPKATLSQYTERLSAHRTVWFSYLESTKRRLKSKFKRKIWKFISGSNKFWQDFGRCRVHTGAFRDRERSAKCERRHFTKLNTSVLNFKVENFLSLKVSEKRILWRNWDSEAHRRRDAA